MWNRLNKSMMFCQMVFGLSFYGVMVIMTRFFLQELNYNEADTMMVVGAFSSIGPLFAIAGGFIADKFLGIYRSLTIAYGGFALGYGCLVVGASITSVPLSLAGIALASYSRGLMSPSYPGLYKRTFQSQEDFEKGYPINYSVNNIGAVIGQYMFPFFVGYLAYSGSFAISSIMAFIAFVVLIINNKGLVGVAAEIDQKAVSMVRWIQFLAISAGMIALVFWMFSNMDMGKNVVYAIGAAALLYFAYLMARSSKSDALRMGTILIMVVLTTAFFVYYGQMMTSMTMLSINTMQGDLFGIIPIEPEASMAMNPLWCMIAGPVIAGLFVALEKRRIYLQTATKVAWAFILTAAAFGVLTAAVKTVGEDVLIRPEVFFVVHGFLAFGEVIVGSMVVAFILSVAPKAIESFSVSLFSVAVALSGIIGAVVSGNVALAEGEQVSQLFVNQTYGDFYWLLTELAVVMVVIALGASVAIRKMLAISKAADQGAGVVAEA